MTPWSGECAVRSRRRWALHIRLPLNERRPMKAHQIPHFLPKYETSNFRQEPVEQMYIAQFKGEY